MRRLLVRERQPHQPKLAERRAEEREPERLVRPALARRRGVPERRVCREEPERDGHDRVPRDRGGCRGDVCGEEECVEVVRAQRRVDPARRAQVFVGSDGCKERGVDRRVLGGDEPIEGSDKHWERDAKRTRTATGRPRMEG